MAARVSMLSGRRVRLRFAAHRIVRQLALGVDGASHEAEDPLAEGHCSGSPDSGIHGRRKAHGSGWGFTSSAQLGRASCGEEFRQLGATGDFQRTSC